MDVTLRAGLALAAYVLVLGLTFGVRAARQRAQTGDSGLRGITGTPGSPEWLGGVFFVVALVLFAVSPVVAILGWMPVLAGAFWSSVWPVLLGWLLVVAGTGYVLWSQAAMGHSWRVGVDHGERTELVTSGPFAQVRNPVFSGIVAAATGFALLVPGWFALAALLMLVAAIRLQVRHAEEPYLLATHGEAYRRYAASTGRFLPGVGCLR